MYYEFIVAPRLCAYLMRGGWLRPRPLKIGRKHVYDIRQTAATTRRVACGFPRLHEVDLTPLRELLLMRARRAHASCPLARWHNERLSRTYYLREGVSGRRDDESS
jgi:hypothetical protein